MATTQDAQPSTADPVAPVHLGTIVKEEFELGLFYQKVAWAMDVLTLVAALTAAIATSYGVNEHVEIAIACLTFLLAIARWFAALRARSCKEAADQGRRAVLLCTAFHWKMSESEFHNSVLERLRTVRSFRRTIVMDRVADPGYKALAEKLLQRAHRARFTYREHANWFWGLVIVFAVALVSLLLLSVNAPSQAISTLIAKMVLFVLTFDSARNLVEMAMMFGKAREEIGMLETRLRTLLESDTLEEPEMLFLFSNYNAIVERTPITLGSIYSRIKKRLDGAEAEGAP